MNSLPFTLAASALLALATQAQAAVTATATPVPVNSTLVTAGWQGWLITLTTTAATGPILVVDMKDNPTNLPNTNIRPIGIAGPLHQSWINDFITNAGDPVILVKTPTSIGNTDGSGSFPGATAARRDSVFLNAAYYTVGAPGPFTEDNNGLNGSSPTPPPFNTSPLVDIAGVPEVSNGTDYGVGSIMTFTGGASFNNAVTTLNLAFIILPSIYQLQPTLSNSVASIRGAVFGFNDQDHPTSFELFWSVPEPASLGILVPGLLVVLARRRRAT